MHETRSSALNQYCFLTHLSNDIYLYPLSTFRHVTKSLTTVYIYIYIYIYNIYIGLTVVRNFVLRSFVLFISILFI